jgi:predicted ester cyclase
MASLSRDEKVALIHRFFDANAKKSKSQFDFIHDDIEFSIPEMELWDATGHMAHGKEAFVAMQSSDFEAFPDLTCPVDRIFVDGETAIVQGRMTATDLSHLDSVLPPTEGQNVDRSSRTLAFRQLMIVDFEGDKIIKLVCYYDLFNYMVVQLGLSPDQLMGIREMSRQAALATVDS